VVEEGFRRSLIRGMEGTVVVVVFVVVGGLVTTEVVERAGEKSRATLGGREG